MDNHSAHRSTIDPESLAGFLAFGRASVAFLEATRLIANGPKLGGEAADLLVELQVTQARLRCLFACGRDDEVALLVPTVLDLADRTTDAIRRSRI